MKLLPVAERELRVASRRRGTYWTRFAAAAVGMAVMGVILLSTQTLPPGNQSQMVFVTLSMLAFAYCLLSGLVTTSDCVSEERREGTLGLLFLTNLRGYDVVVGKLVASSARSILAVVALLPLIALPMLMGGVEWPQVGAVALVLGNTLFVSLVIGVLVSVLTRDTRHSIGGVLAVLLVWVVLLPLLRELWLEYWVRPRFSGNPVELRALAGWVLDVNPAVLLMKVLNPVMGGVLPMADLWRGLMMQHGLGWVVLVTACVVLPRSWRDRVDVRRAGGITGTASGAVSRERGHRRFRVEVLDWHPFAWVVVRERFLGVTTWVGLAVLAGVWFWGFWEVKGEWLTGAVGLGTAFVAGVWLKLRVASLACRHLHEHRRSGALELVMSTPVTPESMVRGNLMGIRHVMLPPLAAVLAGAGLLLVASLGHEQSYTDRTEVPLTFAVGLGVLVLDLVTLAWSGMWRGLVSSRYVRAYSMTVGMVLLLPWVLFVVSLILMEVVMGMLHLGGNLNPGFLQLLGWWAFIAVGVDLWQWGDARRGLQRRFRELAAEPYGSIPVAGVGGKAEGNPL